MKAIVLGCLTTIKVDSIVSQIRNTQNQEIPYMGPLDLVIILDKKVIPVCDNIKFNIECMNILEKMRVNYRYVDDGEVIEISKRDLLPIDAIGDLILIEEKEEIRGQEPDEFTELHQMLSEYRKEVKTEINKPKGIEFIPAEDEEILDLTDDELRF